MKRLFLLATLFLSLLGCSALPDGTISSSTDNAGVGELVEFLDFAKVVFDHYHKLVYDNRQDSKGDWKVVAILKVTGKHRMEPVSFEISGNPDDKKVFEYAKTALREACDETLFTDYFLRRLGPKQELRYILSYELMTKGGGKIQDE